MSLVIGLHGAKGSGKDQFYKATKEAFPYLDVRKIAYADPIKNEINRIFGLNSEQEYDWFKRASVNFDLTDLASHHVEGRRIVREIGMLMRSYDSHQFVDYVEREIFKAPQAIWCVTDVRFDNEIKSIKNKLSGIMIKIRRDGYHFDGHATETEIPDDACNTVIHNENITLEQFNERVSTTVKNILQTFAII